MHKRIRSLLLKVSIKLNEKKYKKLKYLLKKGKEKTMIVSFSGFPGNGPARYNYVKTLEKVF